MRKLNKYATLALCIAFSVVFAVFASAATLGEMRENGEVSDGSVRFGDVRDGIVSDVSEGGEIFTGEGTGMPGDILGDAGNMGDAAKPDTTNQTGMTNESTSGDTTGSTSADGENGGMGMGILIAVLVVVAVVVIIFLLMPKRRG